MTDEVPEQVEDPGAAALAAKAKAVFAQAERNLEEYLATQKQREAATTLMEQHAAMSRGGAGSVVTTPPRSVSATPVPVIPKAPRKRS